MKVDPRSLVAVILALLVAGAILGPIGARVMDPAGTPTLPETVTAGLVDLLKVITGGLIMWLGNRKETP